MSSALQFKSVCSPYPYVDGWWKWQCQIWNWSSRVRNGGPHSTYARCLSRGRCRGWLSRHLLLRWRYNELQRYSLSFEKLAFIPHKMKKKITNLFFVDDKWLSRWLLWKQKSVAFFNFDKQGIIDFKKFPKLVSCSICSHRSFVFWAINYKVRIFLSKKYRKLNRQIKFGESSIFGAADC